MNAINKSIERNISNKTGVKRLGSQYPGPKPRSAPPAAARSSGT